MSCRPCHPQAHSRQRLCDPGHGDDVPPGNAAHRWVQLLGQRHKRVRDMLRGKAIVRGRQTAQLDKARVLFLIGMRFNNLLRIDKWAWFLKTMPSMLAELESKPEAGLLWYRNYISGRSLMVQQY